MIDLTEEIEDESDMEDIPIDVSLAITAIDKVLGFARNSKNTAVSHCKTLCHIDWN